MKLTLKKKPIMPDDRSTEVIAPNKILKPLDHKKFVILKKRWDS